MAMERMTITMSSKDIDLFERGRCDSGMNKSAYVRLLIAEHEHSVPNFILYKEIIEKISELNTLVKEVILSDKVNDDIYKLQILEQMRDIKKELRNIAKE